MKKNNLIPHLRRQKQIDRLSSKFKLRGYNLQEHSYMVAVLFIQVCKQENIDITSEQIDYVLKHDLVEVVTADLQFPVKNFNKTTENAWDIIEKEVVGKGYPELRNYIDIKDVLNDELYRIFKLCDCLDLWMFCTEEVRFGNSNPEISQVVNTCERLFEHYDPYHIYPYFWSILNDF